MTWLLGAIIAVGFVLSAGETLAADHPPFQALVDATPDGGTLLPPPGIYSGPVEITRPINIYGGGKVIIDNGGKGTVMVLRANHSILSGLVLRGSGDHHTKLDACLHVRSHFNVIKDLVLDDCLFGIDLSLANNNVIKRNRITSKKGVDIGLRGDAIRIWYCIFTRIEDNVIVEPRDGILVWYARHSEVSRNHVSKGRYALHFMYSDHNKANGNDFRGNTVGIFLMFSNAVEFVGNDIVESNGPAGIGIGMKEASEVVVRDNSLIGNATALYLDTSPNDPEFANVFEGNRVAFNGVGVSFHSDWAGNQFRRNDFFGNFTEVMVRDNGSAARHVWEGNYWDVYEGFDRDGDGRGDSPFEMYAYADRLWMDVPSTGFFRGSPVLELIDFIERLAPFSEPVLILRDLRPQTGRVAEKQAPAPEEAEREQRPHEREREQTPG